MYWQEGTLSRKEQRRHKLIYKMLRESKMREILKRRVENWMGSTKVKKQRNALDMMILETFFFIYYSLEEGFNIHEIGNQLGIFPVP